MLSRKAKELVLAREGLQTLTPAELTEVSGGGGEPHRRRRERHEHREHRKHRRHRKHFD